MYQIKEIESLIKTRKPRYLNRFNRISARWQSKLQKYQEDGKLSEYVEYSDKIKNHIGRIRICIDMQRGGAADLFVNKIIENRRKNSEKEKEYHFSYGLNGDGLRNAVLIKINNIQEKYQQFDAIKQKYDDKKEQVSSDADEIDPEIENMLEKEMMLEMINRNIPLPLIFDIFILYEYDNLLLFTEQKEINIDQIEISKKNFPNYDVFMGREMGLPCWNLDDFKNNGYSASDILSTHEARIVTGYENLSDLLDVQYTMDELIKAAIDSELPDIKEQLQNMIVKEFMDLILESRKQGSKENSKEMEHHFSYNLEDKNLIDAITIKVKQILENKKKLQNMVKEQKYSIKEMIEGGIPLQEIYNYLGKYTSTADISYNDLLQHENLNAEQLGITIMNFPYYDVSVNHNIVTRLNIREFYKLGYSVSDIIATQQSKQIAGYKTIDDFAYSGYTRQNLIDASINKEEIEERFAKGSRELFEGSKQGTSRRDSSKQARIDTRDSHNYKNRYFRYGDFDWKQEVNWSEYY